MEENEQSVQTNNKQRPLLLCTTILSHIASKIHGTCVIAADIYNVIIMSNSDYLWRTLPPDWGRKEQATVVIGITTAANLKKC